MNKSEKNIAPEEQKQEIEHYARTQNLVVDFYVCEPDITKFTQSLQTTEHTIILANIASLGSSLNHITENLKKLLNQKLKIVSIKENYFLEPNQESMWLIKGIEFAINIRNSMLSVITRKALNQRRAQGHKLGRRYESPAKRIWSGKEDEITQKLQAGATMRQTAQDVGMSVVSLYNFLKQHPKIKQSLHKKN